MKYSEAFERDWNWYYKWKDVFTFSGKPLKFIAIEDKNGVSATLQASATTVAPKVADSLTTALTLTWTDPQYATDAKTVKYIVQVDSAGRNFSNAASIVLSVSDNLSTIENSGYFNLMEIVFVN